MTPDELREAVARACAFAVEKQNSDLQAVKALGFKSVEAFVDRAWPNYLPQADAAIALIRAEVLEEAAKVCDMIEEDADRKARKMYNGDIWLGESQGCGKAAAAIRALKEKNT